MRNEDRRDLEKDSRAKDSGLEHIRYDADTDLLDDTAVLDKSKLPFADNPDTGLLEEALMCEIPYEVFMEKYGEDVGNKSFTVSLRKLINSKGLEFQNVPIRTGINRSYFYQIANGTRSPSRDKLVLICICVGADLDETNEMLKLAHKQPLYARSKRDSVIIYAISHKYKLPAANKLLTENGHQILT